jgi:uncharacterized protein with PIN domain
MYQVFLRFYGHMNRFLPAAKRDVEFASPFKGQRSVKDMIESMGVPHTEIGAIRVNNHPVDFNYHLRDDDHIEVFSANEETLIQPELPTDKRFVLDVHLGRLAAHLRMLGFDTLYPEDYRDEELARISSEENRILLTRDVGLLKRSIVKYGYFVQETDPWRQLAEILKRFDLIGSESQMRRCTQCNGSLHQVDKNAIADQVMPQTREVYDEFFACASCGKIYWKGSHYDRLEAFMRNLTEGNE